MTQNLARYHARSPRYILNTQDDSLIRVAGANQVPWEEGTLIKNVSLTGLAFTAPSDLCPLLGEVIKIQFIAPGGKQMASHAIVTRLDSQSDNTTLVAVHFYKMEMGHRVALAQGLAKRLKEQADRQQIEDALSANQIIPTSKLLMMSGLITIWISLMALFIRFGYQGLWDLLPK